MKLILGICLVVPKIGSAINNYLTPIIARHFKTSDPDSYKDVGMSLFAGFIVMVIGLLCTFGIYILMKLWPISIKRPKKKLMKCMNI